MFEESSEQPSQAEPLSKKERARMSNLNRAKSIIPRKKKKSGRLEGFVDEPIQNAKKRRLTKSAENRKKAEKKQELSARKEQAIEAAMQAEQPNQYPEEEALFGTYALMRNNLVNEPPRNIEKKQAQSVRGTRFTNTDKSGTRHRASTLKAIFLGASAAALVGVVIYGRVQTNEVYSEIVTAQAEYDDMLAKNVSMRSEMEGKMTVKNVAEYAENVLGLKQIGKSQIQYIQIQTEDEVFIAEPETNLFVRIHEHLNRVWEFIKGE